jgi:hypothetical protein
MSEPIDPASAAPTSESIVDEILEQSRLVSSDARTVRQGLPSSYRMRHDAHYVDELENRSHRAHHAAGSPAASSAVLSFPSSVPVTAALGDLTEELEGLVSCFNLVPRGARRLRERVSLRLADVTARRGLRHALNLRVLLDEPYPDLGDLSVGALLDETAESLQEELRVTETTLRIDAPESIGLQGDRRLLGMALQSCAGALIAMIEASGRRGTLRISATAADRAVRIDLHQDAYRVSVEQTARFADLDWSDRPGGIAAGIALAAASRISKVHGGRLECRREETGCSLLLWLPVPVEEAARVGSLG